MNIDKAIRKRKKSYKRFMLSMSFIFFILPIAFILSGKFYLFYIIYLIIIEILIFLVSIIKMSNESLKFYCDGYKLKIIFGIKRDSIKIICEKVILVHVEKYENQNKNKIKDIDDFKIIILATSKFRNNRMIAVDLNFLKRYPYVADHYINLKSIYPEKNFYYTVIKRAGIKKYPLLDCIYKNCVYAHFTDDFINRLKFYRENSEKYNLTKNNYK